MKRATTYLVRTFAAAMVLALLMINIQVDVEPPYSVDSITFVVNEAEAQDGSGFYMTTRTCWVTGQPIWICQDGSGSCCVSCQSTCSGSSE